jgi:hypothetical protein
MTVRWRANVQGKGVADKPAAAQPPFSAVMRYDRSIENSRLGMGSPPAFSAFDRRKKNPALIGWNAKNL